MEMCVFAEPGQAFPVTVTMSKIAASIDLGPDTYGFTECSRSHESTLDALLPQASSNSMSISEFSFSSVAVY